MLFYPHFSQKIRFPRNTNYLIVIMQNDSENFFKLQSSVIKLICVFVIGYLIEIFNNNFNDHKIFSNIFYMLGGTYLTANVMSKPIMEFQKSLIPFIPMIFKSNQKIEKCIRKFNRLRPFIIAQSNSDNNIKKIEEYIRDAEFILNNSEDASSLDAIITKIDYILTLFEPIPKPKIEIQKVISKFDEIEIENKNELIAKILVPFISKINTDNNNNTDNNPSIKLNPLYLVGSPGTGKTFFVNKMAEILDIPIIPIKNFTQNYNRYTHEYSKFDPKMLHIFNNAMHTAITTKKTKTFIMLFDEFDKKIERASAHYILEQLNSSDSSTFSDEIYDCYIDITTKFDTIMIVTIGNQKLTNIHKSYEPLENRLYTVNFSKMTKELKTNIIYNFMKIPRSPEIDYFINKDKFHGIRQLLMKINIYRTSLNDLFKNTAWENIIKDQLQKDVGDYSKSNDNDTNNDTNNDTIKTRLRKKKVI